MDDSAKSAKSLFLKGFQKLARHLLYLSYNKNNKTHQPIKTTDNGSDITKTTRQKRSKQIFLESMGFPGCCPAPGTEQQNYPQVATVRLDQQ
ncbi:hypothetical protein [Pseudomonas phoenicis]|uniref:hypothetical protein n=1 Tax=unclassified Pseudomonas TaxID=196821 RepID=UPI0039A26BB2